MYVCMYAYMYYTYGFSCMYVCKYMRLPTAPRLQSHTSRFHRSKRQAYYIERIYMCMSVLDVCIERMYVHVYIYIYYVCIYIYIYIYIYICVCVCVCACVCACVSVCLCMCVVVCLWRGLTLRLQHYRCTSRCVLSRRSSRVPFHVLCGMCVLGGEENADFGFYKLRVGLTRGNPHPPLTSRWKPYMASFSLYSHLRFIHSLHSHLRFIHRCTSRCVLSLLSSRVSLHGQFMFVCVRACMCVVVCVQGGLTLAFTTLLVPALCIGALQDASFLFAFPGCPLVG